MENTRIMDTDHSGKVQDTALKVIETAMKIPMVRVNRDEFLIKMFGDRISDKNTLLSEGPTHFFDKEQLDKIVDKRINSALSESTTASFVTGIPGGLAMAATIPADIAQFYGYSLKLAQEISYIYGYPDLWAGENEITDEAKNTLILFLGIMLGVSSAGSAVRILSQRLATQATKRIPQKALTHTLYYPILKKVLKIFGVKLTKASFGKGVSKVIPVVGGLVSGGLNFASMRPMARRLKNELSMSVNYSEADFESDLSVIQGEFEEVGHPEHMSDTDTEDATSTMSKVEPIEKNEGRQLNRERQEVMKELKEAHEMMTMGIFSEEEFLSVKAKLMTEM